MALISTANFYNTGKRNWLDIAAPASPDNSGSSKKQKTSKGHDRTLEESFVELQALNARVSAIAAEISRLHHTPSVADEGEDDSDHTCDPFDFEDPPHHDTLPDMEIDVDIEIDILGNSKVVQKKEPLYTLMSQQELIHIISHLLPTEKLGRVIDIVSESSAAIVTTPTDEVEFDLSALDPITFGELSDYIHLCMCELNGIPTVSLPKYTPPKPASLTSSASSKSLKRLTQKNKKSPAPKASSVNKNAAATATAAAVSPSVKGKSLGKRKRSLSSSAPAPSTPAKSSRRTPLSTPTKKSLQLPLKRVLKLRLHPLKKVNFLKVVVNQVVPRPLNRLKEKLLENLLSRCKLLLKKLMKMIHALSC